MQRFSEVVGRKSVVLRQDSRRGSWLDIQSPNVLAEFVSFCKVPLRYGGMKVVFRGESQFHKRLVPSLYRRSRSVAVRQRRFAAYRDALAALPRLLRGTRFRKDNLGAVLQHYGLKTPWVDVVDDLSIAIWFALHSARRTDRGWLYGKSEESHGWIVFLACNQDLQLSNLRSQHSSRNSRCHAQQAYSLARRDDSASYCNSCADLTDLVIARVRIPNRDDWHLSGFRYSQDYFFPDDEIDNTYRQLRERDIDAKMSQLEEDNDLVENSLGRVALYAAKEKI
jgi:hypothetical protein